MGACGPVPTLPTGLCASPLLRPHLCGRTTSAPSFSTGSPVKLWWTRAQWELRTRPSSCFLPSLDSPAYQVKKPTDPTLEESGSPSQSLTRRPGPPLTITLVRRPAPTWVKD